jgi:hypothetical protein
MSFAYRSPFPTTPLSALMKRDWIAWLDAFVKSLFISERSCPDTADTTADENGRIPQRILSAETV